MPSDGGAAAADAQRVFGVLQQLGGAAQQAGDVRADGDHVAAHRLGVEHVVERRGPEDLAGGHPDQAGDVHHGLGGEPAVLLLGQVAQRDEGRAGLGVERDELPGPGHDVGRQVTGCGGGERGAAGGGHGGGLGHRSTSPITGSMVEQTTTASASRPPRIMTGMPCRLTKLGPRMCIR